MNKIEAVVRVTKAAGIVATPIAADIILTHADIAHAFNTPQPGQERQGFMPTSFNGYTLVDQKTEQATQPEEDPIKNTLVSEAQPGVFTHPMTQDSTTGELKVWSYGVQIKNAGLKDASMGSSEVGLITLDGPSDMGFDVRTVTTYLGDYRGDGARPALWGKLGSKDLLILMDETNDQAPKIAAVVTADDKGFAGILLPNRDVQFGVRVIRASESGPVSIAFGNISKADFADPNKLNHPSVIDADKFLPDSNVAAQPAPVEQPAAPADQGIPEFLAETPVFRFQDAPTNTFFLAQSSRGEGWSHFAEFSLPDRKNGVFYRDRGNVGEMFIQTRGLGSNSSGSLDLTMRINPLFANDYKITGDNNPAENRPGIWIKTQPGAKIQALDANGNVIAETKTDGAGFGGVALPESQTIIRTRVVLPQPGIDTDTQYQFGAERPRDRGKSSTLVLQ